MNLEQLDELLHRYTEAEQHIAGTLVELEARPMYKLIMNGPRTGLTGRRLRAAIDAVPVLWHSFDSLREVLAKARTVRGDGRRINDDSRDHLEVLICGPSILVDVEQLPIEQRTLLGPTEKQTWLTPEQLLDEMGKTFDVVREGVNAVEQVWRDAVPRLDAANAALARLDRDAAAAGVSDEPALSTLRDTIHEFERTLGDDPLALDARISERLDAALSIAGARVDELAAGRSTLEGDAVRASALIDDMRRLRADALAAASEASVKIAGATVVEPPDIAVVDGPNGLAAELDAVREIADWQPRRRRLDAWFARAEPLAEELARVAEANRAPLVRRDELRGLLTAYRAKAADIGTAEHERVSALVRAAHQQLHAAPTDVARAEQLVTELGAVLRQLEGPR